MHFDTQGNYNPNSGSSRSNLYLGYFDLWQQKLNTLESPEQRDLLIAEMQSKLSQYVLDLKLQSKIQIIESAAQHSLFDHGLLQWFIKLITSGNSDIKVSDAVQKVLEEKEAVETGKANLKCIIEDTTKLREETNRFISPLEISFLFRPVSVIFVKAKILQTIINQFLENLKNTYFSQENLKKDHSKIFNPAKGLEIWFKSFHDCPTGYPHEEVKIKEIYDRLNTLIKESKVLFSSDSDIEKTMDEIINPSV